MEESACHQELAGLLSSRRAEPATAPSSQFPSLLDELRKHYGLSDKPPFAINIQRKAGHRPGDIRRLVLASDDGEYPQAHVQRVDLVFRRWNKRCMFATIEINGSLEIVKCVVGGSSNRRCGEAAFKHWQRPQKRFSEFPIAFEDRDAIEAITENHQVPPSAWSTVPAARDVIRKKILRASKSLGHSQINKDRGSYDEPRKYACSSEAMFAGEISSGDSSSSSDNDEGHSSLNASQANSSKLWSVKAEPSDSRIVLTPATAISGAFLSSERVTSPRTQTLDPRPKVNSLQLEEIDKLLIQLRDDGKTFEEIKEYFGKVTGLKFSRSAWYSRYNRVKGGGGTFLENDTSRSKSNNSLKRSRKIATPSNANRNLYVDSNDETDDADLRREPAKRAFRKSQLARPPFIPQAASTTKVDPQRLRTPYASPQVPAPDLPAFMQEACEADKMLLHMKDVQHKSWSEIRKTWTAMTGQETAGSTLPSRYRRLKARRILVPTAMRAPIPSIPAKNHRSYQNDSIPAGYASPVPVTKPATSSMPTLASHKLNRTTLRISHSGSFTPLKLRSCKTISELFDAVADICDLSQTAHRKTVSTLKATFQWIPANDSSRTMLLKEGLEDSFEFLLETIDEAPCWETEYGKCTVNIEVVHRNISGEPAGEGSIGSWPATDLAYTQLLQHLGT